MTQCKKTGGLNDAYSAWNWFNYSWNEAYLPLLLGRKKPSGKKAFILEINVLLTRTSKDDIMLDCRKLGNTVKMILKLSWLDV